MSYHWISSKADHLHTPENVKKQTQSRLVHSTHQAKEDAAQDDQRGRLRDSSLNIPSNKKKRRIVHDNSTSPAVKKQRVESQKPTSAVQPPTPLFPESLTSIALELSRISRPSRYDTESWLIRRNLAIKKLAPLFPGVDFGRFCERVNELSLRNKSHGQKNLSASELLTDLQSLFRNLKISVETLRVLLKLLSFGWLKTHSSYYDSIFDRYDIVEHRKAFAPIWRYLLTSANVFLAIGDGSHQHQNERNSHGWIDKTIKFADELPSGAGLGARVNFWTFITPHGVLEDSKKQTVTEISKTNSTLENEDIIGFIEKGAKAMSEHPLAKGKLKVLSIDGAIINKMFPKNSIVPSNMNFKDGGKNRNEMKSIGQAGLKRVLEAMGKDFANLKVEELRSLLWSSDAVMSQLTEAEAAAAKYDVTLIYTPKSPPRFSACEPYFRFEKRHLQNLFDVQAIRNKVIEFDKYFLISQINKENKAHVNKWFNLSLKYAEYFAKGGNENIRENEMERLDLNLVGHPLPPLILIRNQKELSNMIHSSNWILIRGKHYPKSPSFWVAEKDWEKRLGKGC